MNSMDNLVPILFTDIPSIVVNGTDSESSGLRNRQDMSRGESPSDTKHVICVDWPEYIGLSKSNGTMRGGTRKQKSPPDITLRSTVDRWLSSNTPVRCLTHLENGQYGIWNVGINKNAPISYRDD